MNHVVAQFLKRLKKNKKGVLLLDYDGTLAPFKKKRNRALMHSQVALALKTLLTSQTRIVIISGRAINDLVPLLRLSPLPEIWGSHGLEQLKNNKHIKEKLSSTQRKGLKEAYITAYSVLAPSHLEKKPFSIAAHVRGLGEKKKKALLETLENRWKITAQEYGLELHPFKEGIEIRIPGKTKGDAVRAVLSQTPSHIPVAYLGDDKTDEDAFRALGKRGLKIFVGKNAYSKYADVCFTSFQDVALFFRKWEQVL